jgi:4-hydroxy-tetrahydrodipicolinate reductase
VVRAVLIGISGRMGLALVRAASESKEISIAAAVASPRSAALGKDAGELAGTGRLGVTITADLATALAQADVAIDFSNGAATQTHLAACRQARKPLLVGTTGYPEDTDFDAAAKDIPLLVAPNTSLGVSLLIELVRQAAAALPPEFDIEIIEAHHRMKKDAPSGTALALGKAAAEGRNRTLDSVRQGSAARQGSAVRQGGEIGFAVVRGGDIVGEHSVLFAGMGESLTLSHRATDRALFARGALQAAAWLEARSPARYFMRDLFTHKSGS